MLLIESVQPEWVVNGQMWKRILGLRDARLSWLCAGLLAAWIAVSMSVFAQEGAEPSRPDEVATPDLNANDYGPVRGKEPFKLAFLNPYPENAYWQAVQASVVDRAVADAVTVDVFALESPSAPEQIAQISEVIAQGYDGMLIGVVDPAAVVPGIEAANEAGIPVLAVDTRPEAGEIVSLVQIDNVSAAQAAGVFIAAAIGGQGTVVNLMGSIDSEVAQDRDDGLHAALDQFADIEVISERANWSRDLAASSVRQHVPPPGAATPIGEPGLSAIFAANDAMALGALDVVKEREAEHIVVVGFGGAEDALTAIEAGDLSATVAPLPTRTGAIAVDLMVQFLNGETVPSRADPGFFFVTADNFDQFTS